MVLFPPRPGDVRQRPSYSKGVSLALHEHDTVGWRHQLRTLRALHGVRHVELCLEDVHLTREEVALLRDLLDGWAVAPWRPTCARSRTGASSAWGPRAPTI
jgi:hypothetical protein